jgi:hypothetical protein
MLSIEFADAMRAPQIEEAVMDLENQVRATNPEIIALFVKPQTATVFEDQRHRYVGPAPPQPTTPPVPT